MKKVMGKRECICEADGLVGWLRPRMKGDGKARTRLKGDGGNRRFARGRLRTRVTRKSEADGLVGWLRPRMKGDGEAGL